MSSVLARNGIVLDATSRALDFGCGCGRLARWWPSYFDAELEGNDLDRAQVRWCSENLPFISVTQNGLEQRLDHEDGRFDFVYALSVLTHLPVDLGLAWLTELQRVVKPGGHLFFSVSGSRFLDRLTPEQRLSFERGEVVTLFPEGAGSNACSTFHPPEYVRAHLPGGLRLVDSVVGPDSGLAGSLAQDAYLVQRDQAP